MKKLIILLVVLGAAYSANAQSGVTPSTKNFGRTTQETGLTLSTDGSLSAAALNLIQYWGVGHDKQRFKIGLGGRLTSSYAKKQLEYITAAADLTSGKTGPAVFFADQIPANIDTMHMYGTQVNALNLYLALRYDFCKKVGVEFNIDLVGLSFGAQKLTRLTYDNAKVKNSFAQPTVGNALLISDNDLGSLNSELMFSYWHRKNVKFKAGFVFLFNEYDLYDEAQYFNENGKFIDAERFRHKSLQYGLGVIYVIKNKNNKNLNLKN
jgi:hypothetical protein